MFRGTASSQQGGIPLVPVGSSISSTSLPTPYARPIKTPETAGANQLHRPVITIPVLGYEIERQPGVFEGTGRGLYGYQRNMFGYDVKKTRHLFSPFLSPELTICASYKMWLVHIGYVIYALLLMVYLAETKYPDTTMGDQKPACSTTNGVPDGNQNICNLKMASPFPLGED